MLRITTSAAVRTLKPFQVAAVAPRAYTTTGKFTEKEQAEETKYIRAKVWIQISLQAT
jgi:hypothetical protein